MDESLRNRTIDVFQREQKQLDDAFEPSSDVKAPENYEKITVVQNGDGSYSKNIEEVESNFYDDSVVGKVENQIKEDAETLQAFCKEFDNQIITLNAQINTKKQEIVTLSTEAIARNCWPGIAYSTITTSGTSRQTGLGLSVTQNFGNDYSMFEDRDALEIYKKMAGPDVDYGAENPFDPTSIVTLTSANSGFGHENNKDNGRLNAGDAATEVEATDYNVGGGGDGSKEYLTNFESSTNLGTVRSDVSTVLVNHTTLRNVGAFRAYGGVGVAPEATNTSLTGTDGGNRCIAIRTEIDTLISDVQTLRTQRDAAVNRANLNKVKEKKMEKELQNWGSNNVKSKQTQRKTSNADVISAVDAMI